MRRTVKSSFQGLVGGNEWDMHECGFLLREKGWRAMTGFVCNSIGGGSKTGAAGELVRQVLLFSLIYISFFRKLLIFSIVSARVPTYKRSPDMPTNSMTLGETGWATFVAQSLRGRLRVARLRVD